MYSYNIKVFTFTCVLLLLLCDNFVRNRKYKYYRFFGTVVLHPDWGGRWYWEADRFFKEFWSSRFQIRNHALPCQLILKYVTTQIDSLIQLISEQIKINLRLLIKYTILQICKLNLYKHYQQKHSNLSSQLQQKNYQPNYQSSFKKEESNYLQRTAYSSNIPTGEPVYDPQDSAVSQYYKNTYGGTLPICQMRLQKREKRKRKLQYVTKCLFFGGAVGLVVIAALRFTAVEGQSIHQAIMNCYYLFFGVITSLTQLNVHKVADQFRFLNYYWGKGIFSLFLASISFSNLIKNQVKLILQLINCNEEAFIQWIMTIYFFTTAALMFILAVIDKSRDLEQLQKDEIIIQQTYNEDSHEGGIYFETIPFANYFKSKLSENQKREGDNHYGAVAAIQQKYQMQDVYNHDGQLNHGKHGINQDDAQMMMSEAMKHKGDLPKAYANTKAASKYSYEINKGMKSQKMKRAFIKIYLFC